LHHQPQEPLHHQPQEPLHHLPQLLLSLHLPQPLLLLHLPQPPLSLHLPVSLLLKPTPHHKLELQPHPELDQELEPTPRPLLLNAVTESRKLMNNAKVEHVVHTDADFTRPTDLVDSDPLDLPQLASRKDDAMDLEFADQLSSNKTPRRDAPKPMVLEDSAASLLESVSKFLFYLRSIKI
jgi:hypothetical protein